MVATAALLAVAPSFSASAADLGGNCCADLEERIAELEATTVRKGNRKVSLTLSGQVSQSLMWWDDGGEANTYQASNFGNPSYFALTGEAEISKGWSAGYSFLTYIDQVFTGSVDATSDDAATPFFLWQNHWWIKSEQLGKISLGLASRATDLVPEQDLSGSIYDPSYSLVSDWGFFFNIRRSDGDFSNVRLFAIGGYSFTGETGNIIRYDSPTWQGFTFAAAWGEDDMGDVALFYAKDHGPFSIAAAAGYAHTTDENGLSPLYGVPEYPSPFVFDRLEQDTVLGSVSILHNPSGLSVTVAAGDRDFGGTVVVDPDGVSRTPDNISYIYAKLGLITKPTSLGNTNFYAEYGHYRDALSAGQGADVVAGLSLSGDPAAVCAAAGEACRVVGSESNVWGIGVVQLIDAASMALHLGYRHWSSEVDLVDVNGDAVPTIGLEDFDSVLAGARISF